MILRPVFALLLAALCLAQTQTDPWMPSEIMEPAALAKALQGPHPPLILSVAFPVLYRNRHILHAIDANAASKPEGIDTLKKLVANMPKDSDLVIYCGCCPMTKCPNVRPAFRTLKGLGFTHVRVVDIPTNMHEDWYSKDYPSEK